MQELIECHLAAMVFPGAVGVLARGRDVETVALGQSHVGGPSLRDDAIMPIQSMTKAVTAVAALRQVAAGGIGLDDAVDRWLPELADRSVLTSPTAPLHEVVPAERAITLRDLLLCTSGYGMILAPSPLRTAMTANGTEAGPEPPGLGADEWLARLAELPLVGEPGRCWRYHHSYAILGILLSRLVGRPLGEHLATDLFEPLGMSDTGFWVPDEQLDRLPAGYRHDPDGLVELEPAGGGFYAGAPPFDVSHGELVSTASDYLAFCRVLTGEHPELLAPELLAQLARDQVSSEAKAYDAFFPGFWEGMGWGFGVGVVTTGAHRGRIGWSGGGGTDFLIDPDGTIAILLTRVELGHAMAPVLEDMQQLTG